MQLSHYLKIYPYQEQPDHLLLFSTKQSSKVLLAKKTFESIESCTLSPSDEALLSRLGMIVPDREAEKQSIFGLIEKLNKKNPNLNITVVLNLDCNLACVYCFEGDIKGKLYMADQTAEHLVDFIKAKFAAHKNAIVIDFYGGEPLLSTNLIKSISLPVKSFAASRGAAYSFNLVTNGSLFKRRTAAELAALGLKNVKITLDGPAEIHNRYRPFKSGAGSFNTIIANIKDTWDLVKISLGGNFGWENYEKFVLLLDYLETVGLGPDKISAVKFDPVVKRPPGDTSPADYKDGCMSINEPWLLGAERLLRKEILKRSYYTPKIMPMSCMIEATDTYVINFDGVIYKCPAFIGKKGFAIGNLQNGLTDYADIYKLDIWKNEDCDVCEYLPLCFGGCRYMTFVRDGNIDKPDCKKTYFDGALENLIKQDIKFRSP